MLQPECTIQVSTTSYTSLRYSLQTGATTLPYRTHTLQSELNTMLISLGQTATEDEL